MGNREDKPTWMRILSSVASLMLIGSLVFILVAGFNLYVASVLTTGGIGLAAPSIGSAEGFLDMIIGFFEAFIEGIMEIIFGIFEAITSIFG